MKIKENERFPEVSFFSVKSSGPEEVKSSELFNKKKIVLVGVPGAFTPTCSEEHLPGYIKLSEDFKKKGIDKIFFVSVNDPFVMKAWGDVHEKNNIDFLADLDRNLVEATGLKLDLSKIGLGKRFSRFAILIDNGLIVKIFAEDGAELDKSKAENVLSSI